MDPLEKSRHRLRLLAAVTGVGAMAVLGALTVIDGATPGATESVAVKFSSTTTVKTPPTAPETSFASPTVKAPHK
ncbi:MULTISPECIES: hypothetical protein [unclassified Mycolicibacterium]|uniref:hypothetical protein n=1 Tax=unclassified Mycolicibacterium TaxID=2636767 RepID=UPI001EE4C344|nr:MULTISPECIES: hypothetical protein [unclassified Mycolicibacterium]